MGNRGADSALVADTPMADTLDTLISAYQDARLSAESSQLTHIQRIARDIESIAAMAREENNRRALSQADRESISAEAASRILSAEAAMARDAAIARQQQDAGQFAAHLEAGGLRPGVAFTAALSGQAARARVGYCYEATEAASYPPAETGAPVASVPAGPSARLSGDTTSHEARITDRVALAQLREAVNATREAQSALQADCRRARLARECDPPRRSRSRRKFAGPKSH